MNETYGELSHSDGYVTALMEREIEVPVETVWQMLATEENRVKWLAPGSIDLKVGGRAILDFKDSYVLVNSEVTACEPNRVLEFSWSSPDEPLRPIRFELETTTSGSKILLSVSIPDEEVVARSCAGWEAHLTMLQAAAAGVSVKFPIERFKLCREDFDQQLLTLTMAGVEVLKL
tara:strand:- start:1120 stop:1644 length:525 start_codon:yes stop_codon:yes gene_type:complete